MICMISKVKVRLGEMIFMSCNSHVSLKLPFFGVGGGINSMNCLG